MTNPHPPYGHGNLDKAGQRAASGVTEAEAPYLEKLGETIRTLRLQGGLIVKEAGEQAELHHLSWARLEAGTRRTWTETLARIAKVLVPRVGLDAKVLHLYLVKLAGPALGGGKVGTWHLHGGTHG